MSQARLAWRNEVVIFPAVDDPEIVDPRQRVDNRLDFSLSGRPESALILPFDQVDVRSTDMITQDAIDCLRAFWSDAQRGARFQFSFDKDKRVSTALEADPGAGGIGSLVLEDFETGSNGTDISALGWAVGASDNKPANKISKDAVGTSMNGLAWAVLEASGDFSVVRRVKLLPFALENTQSYELEVEVSREEKNVSGGIALLKGADSANDMRTEPAAAFVVSCRQKTDTTVAVFVTDSSGLSSEIASFSNDTKTNIRVKVTDGDKLEVFVAGAGSPQFTGQVVQLNRAADRILIGQVTGHSAIAGSDMFHWDDIDLRVTLGAAIQVSDLVGIVAGERLVIIQDLMGRNSSRNRLTSAQSLADSITPATPYTFAGLTPTLVSPAKEGTDAINLAATTANQSMSIPVGPTVPKDTHVTWSIWYRDLSTSGAFSLRLQAGSLTVNAPLTDVGTAGVFRRATLSAYLPNGAASVLLSIDSVLGTAESVVVDAWMFELKKQHATPWMDGVLTDEEKTASVDGHQEIITVFKIDTALENTIVPLKPLKYEYKKRDYVKSELHWERAVAIMRESPLRLQQITTDFRLRLREVP